MKPYTVNQEKWSNLTIFEQMGNIYSEVGRSFAAKRRSNEQDVLSAKGRAIDLFDITVAMLVAQHSPKSKEVLRAKEQYLTVLDGKKSDEASMAGLERYFMQFALAARLNR